jgi:hypothetical protein
MTTKEAFVATLGEIAHLLATKFPDDNKVKKYQEKLEKSDPQDLLDSFTNDLKQFGTLISNKNSAFFKSDAHIVKRLHLQKLFKKLSADEKEKVWQHLSTLALVSTTISAMPSELLNTIENIAKQCVENVDLSNMDKDNIDFGKLMSGVQGMLGNMKLPDNLDGVEGMLGNLKLPGNL